MKRLLALALLLVAVPAAGRELRLAVAERVELPFPGVTTAFAVDSTIVEARSGGGAVSLVGRRGGQTTVTIVAGATVETMSVRVDAPAARPLTRVETAAERTGGSWEGRYESGTGRVSTTLVVSTGDDERSAQLRVFGVEERHGGPEGGSLRSLPSASLELVAPGRSVVLLDELVAASPLTLDGTVVRGIHLRRGSFALHAGIASATPWDDVLLPADGDRALGVSYGLSLGGTRLVPAVLWLPDAAGAADGVVALGIERGEADGPFALRGELGWGGAPGAAVDLGYRRARHHGWLTGVHRPGGFAALGVARTPGTFVDGAWTGQLGGRTTADLSVSASDVDVAELQQRAHTARFDVRHRVGSRWTLDGGLTGGSYSDRRQQAAAVERLALAIGGSYDGPHFGAAARYRYQETSVSSRGGHGGRLTLRANRGGWRAHLFADAQEDSPTVALLLRSVPGLERAFAELGLAASTPEEAVRLLRDNGALLADHGVTVGALELAPLHLHGGLDVAWRGDGEGRPEVGLRLSADEARGVVKTRRGFLATLSTSRRLFGATDLLLAYSRWSTSTEGGDELARESVEVAVRTRLSAPRLPGKAIRGTVRRDDGASGAAGGGLPPLAGVEVVLDGDRRTRTDAAGGFIFKRPGGGEHAVAVVLPAAPGAYFTRPSTAIVASGGVAEFGVALGAARLSGHVRTDAGTPIEGAVVRLEGAAPATAITNSSGAFSLDAPAGDGEVLVVAESLPAGFDLGGLRPVAVRLAPGAPVAIELRVQAHRAVSGRVSGGEPSEILVTVKGLGRSVRPAADGRFVLRGLPAGRLTVIASGPDSAALQMVEVPAEPSTLAGVTLTLP